MVCAAQRAFRLQNKSCVLELCVGPSFRDLKREYARWGIQCFGNDIDSRWKNFYPSDNWTLGDCHEVFSRYHQMFDSIVFAPPLSSGCSGTRKDSLKIFEVKPSYIDFLHLVEEVKYRGLVTLVLPGRSLSTKEDRSQFWKLKRISSQKYDIIGEHPLTNGCVKYIDLDLRLRG